VRIALLGAHGKTGRLVAECARSLGHELHALEGSALDRKPLAGAIHGSDVVISTLGPVKNSPPHLCSRATWLVLETMWEERVPRLVMVTGALSGPQGNLSPLYRALLRFPPLAGILDDRRRQESLVRASLTRWTLVRPPPRLTDDDAPGDPEISTRAFIGPFDHTSRRHLAEVLLRAATTDAWKRQGIYVRS